MSADPKSDPICAHCIYSFGDEAHCTTGWPSVDHRVAYENEFAELFREWVEKNPLWAQGTSFEEVIYEPKQTIPAIVAHTTVGALRTYYYLDMDGGIASSLFRLSRDKIVLNNIM